MKIARSTLVGTWQKLSGDPCGKMYPNQIEFRDDGVYLVPMQKDEFWQWQSGDFEMMEEGVIRMQTANDAMLPYRYSISENRVLTFWDQDGCKVSYQQLR